MSENVRQSAGEPFCYLTTTGRRSGKPHTIEIWFALINQTVYMLAGNHGSDWVRNAQHTPAVTVRIGGTTYAGQARLVSDPAEEVAVRAAVLAKYQPGEDDDLSEWGRTSLPVAVDLAA